jgi:hypothetical protein
VRALYEELGRACANAREKLARNRSADGRGAKEISEKGKARGCDVTRVMVSAREEGAYESMLFWIVKESMFVNWPSELGSVPPE